MNDTYSDAIARAADSARITPAQLRQAQQEMWARHRYEAWRTAPVGVLSGGMVQTGNARRIKRAL